MELMTIVSSCALTFILVKFIQLILNYVKLWQVFRKFPGPSESPQPFLGHSFMYLVERERSYENEISIVKKNVIKPGHEVGMIWYGVKPVLLVAGPKSAEQLLQSSHHMKKAFVYTFLHPWLGTGLLTAYGDKWRTRRKLLTPSFHFNILEGFLEVMNEQARIFRGKMMPYAESGEAFNICGPVTLCALDVICETAMGQPVYAQSNENSEYVKAVYKCTELIQDRENCPWLWPDFIYYKSAKGKAFRECLKVLHDFTKSVIIKRKEEMNAAKPNPRKRLALLDLLLTASQDDRGLTFRDIQEEVDTFMFEGHDTTAAAMHWSMLMIGNDPEIQRKLQKEVDEVFGDDSDRDITMEDLRQLNYVEMALKETLRMFPSVPVIGRETTCDCILDGHFVPKGTQCAVYLQLINKHPNYWKDPEKYDPERFTVERMEGRNPFLYLPFSAGPRNCIGQKFALMEGKVTLANIFRNFNVTACETLEQVGQSGELVLRPFNGVKVKLQKRR